MKNIKIKLLSHKIAIAIMGIFFICGCVVYAANYGEIKEVKGLAENGGTVNIYEATQPNQPSDTSEDTSEKGLGIAGNDFYWDFMNWNGNLVAHKTGSFINASTTIVSFLNPFMTASSTTLNISTAYEGQASSTVTTARLAVTGVATTSYSIACGASATAYATPAYNIISSDIISTSTYAIIENNITSSYGTPYGGGTVDKIMLGEQYPYFVCKVTTTGYNRAFTDTGNSFDGKYSVVVEQIRQ